MVDPLDELLGAYKLEPLDRGLADRIVATATASSRRRQPWFAQAAMMAGVALLGFWLGGSHPQSTAISVTANVESAPSYLEKALFGAHTIDEVLL